MEELDSAEARSILRQVRARNPRALVVFELRFVDAPSIDSSFTLLSASAAQSLRINLKNADANPSQFWRHVGRAIAYHSRHLYFEESRECLTILDIDAGRTDLRLCTTRALERTGDLISAAALSMSSHQ